jgi:hypothetical protein
VPSFAPAASPRVRRSPSSWPPGRPNDSPPWSHPPVAEGRALLTGPDPPGLGPADCFRGFHHWFLHSYASPSCLPSPSRLAVPTRPVVVGAASRPSRRPPGRTAPSFYRTAATARRWRSCTTTRSHRTSWRTHAAFEDITLHDQFLVIPLGLGALPPQPLQLVTTAGRYRPSPAGAGDPARQGGLVDPQVFGDPVIVLPVSVTIRTAPSRNSGSNFRRFSAMTPNPYSQGLHATRGETYSSLSAASHGPWEVTARSQAPPGTCRAAAQTAPVPPLPP